MAITPVDLPRPIAQPAIVPIAPPSLQGARDGALRVVVWFGPEVALPDDEIPCTPGTADTLFGPGVAQRLLITPDTAWLQRLLPRALAAALDETADRGDGGDVVRSTPYSHIYLLRLTGGLGVGHVCDVLGASANVRLVYPEPTCAATAAPTLYQGNTVFKNDQVYLQAAKGINAEPVWAKGHTGSGIQAGVIDSDATFSGLPYSPRLVPVPAPTGTGAAASSTVGTHARLTTGILGCPDNAAIGIGAAPEVKLVFAPVQGVGGGTLAAVTAAFGAMITNGQLVAGDVVNVSLGVRAGLDVKKPYAGYAALLKQDGTPGWPHHLVTEKIGADVRPSGVGTALALEFEPTLLKLVATLVAKHITVVEAAGNGLVALCLPKGGKGHSWVVAKLGADLGGPWLAGVPQVPLAAFRRGLASKAPHLLDRAATASFADGGGIVVAGGQFSTNAGGMIDNIQLNHGHRVDCYVNTPNGQTLGFLGSAGGAHIGGTSLCAPAIAGAAAVVQGIVKAQYKGVLRPAIVRALLSDPDLGTPTKSGSPVGVMPNLETLMKFLETPQGKRDDLLKAVVAQQQKSATRVKAAAAAGGFVHDPYMSFTRGQGSGSWQPLTLASATDIFAP